MWVFYSSFFKRCASWKKASHVPITADDDNRKSFEFCIKPCTSVLSTYALLFNVALSSSWMVLYQTYPGLKKSSQLHGLTNVITQNNEYQGGYQGGKHKASSKWFWPAFCEDQLHTAGACSCCTRRIPEITLFRRRLLWTSTELYSSQDTLAQSYNRKDLRKQQNMETIHLVEAFVVRSHSHIKCLFILSVRTFLWR